MLRIRNADRITSACLYSPNCYYVEGGRIVCPACQLDGALSDRRKRGPPIHIEALRTAVAVKQETGSHPLYNNVKPPEILEIIDRAEARNAALEQARREGEGSQHLVPTRIWDRTNRSHLSANPMSDRIFRPASAAAYVRSRFGYFIDILSRFEQQGLDFGKRPGPISGGTTMGLVRALGDMPLYLAQQLSISTYVDDYTKVKLGGAFRELADGQSTYLPVDERVFVLFNALVEDAVSTPNGLEHNCYSAARNYLLESNGRVMIERYRAFQDSAWKAGDPFYAPVPFPSLHWVRRFLPDLWHKMWGFVKPGTGIATEVREWRQLEDGRSAALIDIVWWAETGIYGWELLSQFGACLEAVLVFIFEEGGGCPGTAVSEAFDYYERSSANDCRDGCMHFSIRWRSII